MFTRIQVVNKTSLSVIIAGAAFNPGLAAADQEAILGFEAPASWTASSGVIGSSSVRSQGSAALGLRDFGDYSELLSPPLATPLVVSPDFSIDVRPPLSPAWGQLQLFVTSPTLNLHNAWVGQASLIGIPANQFTRVSIVVPSEIARSLARAALDLQIKVVLNVPQSNSDWVLDDLRLIENTGPDCADGSPYTLLISGEDGVNPGHVDRMRCTFFSVYPLLVERFNPAATTTVGMIFTDEPGVAWASGTDTFYNKAFLASAPLDSDVVVHEIMHVVQAGYSGEVPGWIIEGTADFVRDAYGLSNAENGWAIPTSWTYGPHYLNGYGDAAAFMKWIDANYRQGEPPVADALDDIMRQGQYSEQTFIDLTGEDVESLWLEYSGGQAPQPDASGVVFFQDADFSGRDFTLAPGTYAPEDVGARGLNDRISSLIVPAGLTVTVFDDTFSGSSAVYSADTSFVGDVLNDKISSIVIE